MGKIYRLLCDSCGIVCLAILCGLSTTWIVAGIIAAYRARTYVESSCLITDVDWKNCGARQGKEGHAEQCYHFQWLVQFQDETKAKTRITGLELYWQRNDGSRDNHEPPSSNPYKIGYTYPCYHSPSDRSGTVQFQKPDKSHAMRLLILGGIVLLLAVGSLLISLKCYPDIDDYASHQNTQLHPAAETTVHDEEENTYYLHHNHMQQHQHMKWKIRAPVYTYIECSFKAKRLLL